MASSRVMRVGGGCVVSARGGTVCVGEAGGAGVGFCCASTQRGRAKSAVANAVLFFIFMLLYDPMRSGRVALVTVEGTKWRKNRGLQSRRGPRRGRALDFHRRRENRYENFKPVGYRNDGQIERLGRDGGARRGTKLTRMRAAGAGIEIGTKVELRRQEDKTEQHSTDTRLVGISEHPYTLRRSLGWNGCGV